MIRIKIMDVIDRSLIIDAGAYVVKDGNPVFNGRTDENGYLNIPISSGDDVFIRIRSAKGMCFYREIEQVGRIYDDSVFYMIRDEFEYAPVVWDVKVKFNNIWYTAALIMPENELLLRVPFDGDISYFHDLFLHTKFLHNFKIYKAPKGFYIKEVFDDDGNIIEYSDWCGNHWSITDGVAFPNYDEYYMIGKAEHMHVYDVDFDEVDLEMVDIKLTFGFLTSNLETLKDYSI